LKKFGLVTVSSRMPVMRKPESAKNKLTPIKAEARIAFRKSKKGFPELGLDQNR